MAVCTAEYEARKTWRTKKNKKRNNNKNHEDGDGDKIKSTHNSFVWGE